MSVREKLVNELLLLGLDGHDSLAVIESQLTESIGNAERAKAAREILASSGLSAAQLSKLGPLISRFVMEFSEKSREAVAAEAAVVRAVEEAAEAEVSVGRKKKSKSKKLTGKDLTDFFYFKGPTTVQKYSDDESGPPKPIIIKVNKPLVMVAPPVPAPVHRKQPKPQPAAPSSVWKEAAPATAPATEAVDYGGFW